MIANDQAIGLESATVQHGGKVYSMLDVIKGVLVGMSMEKLCMAISNAEIERKTTSRTTEDGRQAAMGRS